MATEDDLFIIRGKLYDRIKFTVLVVLPALSTLYFTLGTAWDWPAVDKVPGSLAAIALFLGSLIGISARNYKANLKANGNVEYDGNIMVTPTEDGTTLTFQINPDDLDGKSQLLFSINKPKPEL